MATRHVEQDSSLVIGIVKWYYWLIELIVPDGQCLGMCCQMNNIRACVAIARKQSRSSGRYFLSIITNYFRTLTVCAKMGLTSYKPSAGCYWSHTFLYHGTLREANFRRIQQLGKTHKASFQVWNGSDVLFYFWQNDKKSYILLLWYL